jgi:hypothetical protein
VVEAEAVAVVVVVVAVAAVDTVADTEVLEAEGTSIFILFNILMATMGPTFSFLLLTHLIHLLNSTQSHTRATIYPESRVLCHHRGQIPTLTRVSDWLTIPPLTSVNDPHHQP